MHLPNSLSSESFQPGYLSGQVVSVDVHVHATLPPVEALDQQPELLAVQPAPCYSGCRSNWVSGWPTAACQNASSRSCSAGGTSITTLDSLL
jgi:hypothetical protein